MKLIFLLLVTTLTAFAADISPSTSFGVGFPHGNQVISSGVPAGQVPVSDGTGGSTYQAAGTGTVSTPAAVGASPNANGLTISGANINLQPADASFPGVVTTGTQTIAGDKTFPGLQLHSADGSVTAPKVAWSSDSDTGFYRAASGQVNLSLNGSTTSAGINRQIKFIDFNVVSAGFGTVIAMDAPYSGMTMGTEGTTALGLFQLTAGGAGAAPQMYIEGGGATTGGPVFNLFKNRGTTPTARVAILTNDILGDIRYVGSTTSALQRTAVQLRTLATENFSETNRGAQFSIFNNLTGTASNTEAMRWGGDGQVQFMRASGANMIWNTDGGGSIGAAAANRPLAVNASSVVRSPTVLVGDTGTPNFEMDVRGGAGAATIQLSDTSGGTTSTDGARIDFDSSNNTFEIYPQAETSGIGIDTNIRAGQSSSGGTVTISGGTGTAASSSGGDINLNPGSDVNTNGTGGNLFLRAGSGSNAANSGFIRFEVNGLSVWKIASANDGHFLPGASNLYDVGSTTLPVRGIYLASGGINLENSANNRLDSCTLVAGTCTIANTSIAAVGTDSVFCTGQVAGGTPGGLNVSARNVGTDYTVTSTNVADTSTISCMIVKGF